VDAAWTLCVLRGIGWHLALGPQIALNYILSWDDAHGLHLRPRDLAKVGLMMADGGVWHGTPIISADWYNLSTTWKVDPDGHPRLGYGYYWWTVPEAGGYSGWGHGGQYAFVIPG